MTTFIARKNETLTIEDLRDAKEGDQAIVFFDGYWTVAEYDTPRFGGSLNWYIWSSAEYKSSFAALLERNLIRKHPGSGEWVFAEGVKYHN